MKKCLSVSVLGLIPLNVFAAAGFFGEIEIFYGKPLQVWTHILLMSIAVVSVIIAAAVARFYKRKPWWLNTHRIINSVAVLLAVLAFGSMYVYKEIAGTPHFSTIHGILGLIGIILLVVTPVLAYTALRIKSKQLRLSHRWQGRVAVLFVVYVAVPKLFGVLLS